MDPWPHPSCPGEGLRFGAGGPEAPRDAPGARVPRQEEGKAPDLCPRDARGASRHWNVACPLWKA